jgi:ATP-dependent protease HslVU (ClpYQ) peptidase subunit
MTCIVGFTDKETNQVWIGGDSLGSNGYIKDVQALPKVFRHDTFKNVIMGSTGSFRHMDLLKYSENLFPEIDWYKGKNIDHKYMVKTFIPNLITLFQENVIDKPRENRGGNFLLGVEGKLFEIQNDYSVLQSNSGFAAVGCGGDVALASLITTTKHFKDKLTPVEHITYALEAAEELCEGVQRPFYILSTDEKISPITIN